MTRTAAQGSARAMRATAPLLVCALITVLAGGGCAPPPAASRAATVTIDVDTPPGMRAKQALDMLNSASPIDRRAVTAMAATGAKRGVRATLEGLWWDRPYTVAEVDYFTEHVVLHVVNPFGMRQQVEIDTDAAGLVERLTAELAEPEIDSWSDVDSTLTNSQARYSYSVSRVDDGRCERVAGTDTSESLPLASIFKLYVLYAVAEAVKAGTLSWDEQLTVTERARAVEFTNPREYPAGSTISVRTAAEKMIAVSSNMATDLLIARVGTPAVERALTVAGHHDPQTMTPFPTMHELFSIGWGRPDLRQAWADAVAANSPQARAEVLERARSAPYRPERRRSHDPASAHGIEWYGSAEDVCRVHAALQATANGAAAPVRQILSSAPGVQLDPKEWPYVGAKGGNLPGDLTFSWYAEDGGGQAWVVSFQLSWPSYRGPSAGAWLGSIARQVFALVGRQS